MKTIYESFDGKHFENRSKCIKYEQNFLKSKVDEFFNMVGQVREYCNNTDSCKDCPFLKEDSCGFKDITTNVPWDW